MSSRAVAFLAAWFCVCAAGAEGPSMETCLAEAVARAPDDATVGSLRKACAKQTDRGRRTVEVTAERQSLQRSFTITPHEPNYFLAYTHNEYPNQDPFVAAGAGEIVDKEEAEFQVSFKFPLKQNVLGTRADVLVGYTSRSWWQLYNGRLSTPFRETNYRPEIFLRHYAGFDMLGPDVFAWDLGLVHESNGRSGALSRSWNRLFARMRFDIGSVAAVLNTWYRIPEDQGDDPEDDDNPGIYKYMGYGDLRLIYRHNRHTVTTMYRPGTRKSGFELTWSYPLNDHVRLYAKYFEGYGESLIDFDHKNRRYGIGIAVNDHLREIY